MFSNVCPRYLNPRGKKRPSRVSMAIFRKIQVTHAGKGKKTGYENGTNVTS